MGIKTWKTGKVETAKLVAKQQPPLASQPPTNTPPIPTPLQKWKLVSHIIINKCPQCMILANNINTYFPRQWLTPLCTACYLLPTFLYHKHQLPYNMPHTLLLPSLGPCPRPGYPHHTQPWPASQFIHNPSSLCRPHQAGPLWCPLLNWPGCVLDAEPTIECANGSGGVWPLLIIS